MLFILFGIAAAVVAWRLGYLPSGDGGKKTESRGEVAASSRPTASATPAARAVMPGTPLETLRRIDSPLATLPAKVAANAVWCDRVVYAPNDPAGQLLVVSTVLSKASAGTRLEVSLLDGKGQALATESYLTEEGKPAYLVAGKLNAGALPEGSYTLAARIVLSSGGGETALVSGTFSVGKALRPEAGFPAAGVPLMVPPIEATGETIAPISFGVPLPFGALSPGEKLEVWEGDQPILTQSQPMAYWGPGPDDSVRWMGISFVARYRDGKAQKYVLKKAAAEVASPLKVAESAESVVIETGAVRFQISKRAFRGPEQIEVKQGETWARLSTTVNSAGAYLVDEKGTRYEASADLAPEVRIDENGPVRAAVSIRGWYVNPANPQDRLCQFQVRLYAYAGLSRIDGFQRTIITYDTHARKLADVGFSVPVAAAGQNAVQWYTGIDGQIQSGSVASTGSVFFAQAAPDAVWLNHIDGDPAGKRSDGWLAVRDSTVTAAGFLRDVWEKFPKEISYSSGEMTFHSWPKHGRRIVAPEEEIKRENIHRNLFAHQGPLLDLQLPEVYFNQLRTWHDALRWDRENTSFIGYRSDGSGVSMSIRFGVEYFPGKTPDAAVASQSMVNQTAPSAITDPAWNVGSGVIPFLTAAGDPRWERSDALLEAYATGMSNLAAVGRIYGMWIYGNTNNNWDTGLKAPWLHRIWQNSHYGHASFPWKFYFRSGDPRFLKMARAQTGNLMDVGIVHYVPPEEAGTYAGKTPGGLYHAKGWLPWGVRLRGEFPTDSDVGILQHWTNPKVFLERYLTEVDLEARDVFDLWYNRLVSQYQYRSHYGVGRELTQSISELVDIYQTIWDPRLVGYLRPMGDSALGTPFWNYPSQLGFAFFNRTWPIRYFVFARDPKVIERLEEALPTENYGPYGMASAALLLSQKKEMERAPRLLSVLENADQKVFRSPGDPLDGYGAYSSAVDSRMLDEIPGVQAALAELSPAELNKARAQGVNLDPVFPARSGKNQVRDGSESALILALNPDGRPFKLRFESRMGVDMLPSIARIVDPAGKEVRQIPLHDRNADGSPRQLRYLSNEAPVFEIPGGLPGVYRIEFYGYYPIYRAPLTDLPNEVAVLGQGSQAVNGFLFAPKAGQLTLNFAAGKPQGASRPLSFAVQNLDDGKTFETILLFGSSRTSDSVTLQGGLQGVRAEVSAPGLSWLPADQTVFFAHRWDDFAPVLGRIGEQSTKLDNTSLPAAPGGESAGAEE
ncbi:hypothetical protein [Terrimicrobium sacchariphilum]|nr:hypothetical protein [Terrimicrobium sacchariphilum]